MTSSRRLAFAVVVGVVGAACATAVVPDTSTGGGGGTGGGDSGTGDDGGSPFENYGDGSTTPQGDGGTYTPPKDSGTATPIDSGTTPPPPVDSGAPLPELCTGTNSSHSIPDTGGDKAYDDWCDYDSYYGDPLPCTDNSDCSGNYKASYEPECCYKPVSGGYCEGDFKGKSQCVPQ